MVAKAALWLPWFLAPTLPNFSIRTEIIYRQYYRPPMKLRECNVFGCVCLSTGRRVPCEYYPWLALTVQHPGPVPPASDIWSPRLESCSNLFPSGPPPHCWHLVAGYKWWASGWYASYWNAVLLLFISRIIWEHLPTTVTQLCLKTNSCAKTRRCYMWKVFVLFILRQSHTFMYHSLSTFNAPCLLFVTKGWTCAESEIWRNHSVCHNVTFNAILYFCDMFS